LAEQNPSAAGMPNGLEPAAGAYWRIVGLGLFDDGRHATAYARNAHWTISTFSRLQPADPANAIEDLPVEIDAGYHFPADGLCMFRMTSRKPYCMNVQHSKQTFLDKESSMPQNTSASSTPRAVTSNATPPAKGRKRITPQNGKRATGGNPV